MSTTSTFSNGVMAALASAKIVGVRSGTEHRPTGVWVVVVKGRSLLGRERQADRLVPSVYRRAARRGSGPQRTRGSRSWEESAGRAPRRRRSGQELIVSRTGRLPLDHPLR